MGKLKDKFEVNQLLVVLLLDFYVPLNILRRGHGLINIRKAEKKLSIRKTCQCNVYPLIPHFYIVKLGSAGVYLFFLFLLLNIDCGYSY